MHRVIKIAVVGMILCCVYVVMLNKIQKREDLLKESMARVGNLEKQLERTEMEYDSKQDLEKIGKEMREKKGMIISPKINFFQIDE